MNDKTVEQPANNIWPVYRTLVGVGVFCALIISLVFASTQDVIKQNKLQALNQAIFDVIPATTHVLAYEYSEIKGRGEFIVVEEGQSTTNKTIYVGYDNNKSLAGIALQTQGQGYQDVIQVLYGYAPFDQRIIGLKVLNSRETPGLGDKIEKDQAFLANFDRLDAAFDFDTNTLRNTIVAVKSGEKTQDWQVDGITGATISSVAIANMLDESVSQWAPRVLENIAQLNGDSSDRLKEESNE